MYVYVCICVYVIPPVCMPVCKSCVYVYVYAGTRMCYMCVCMSMWVRCVRACMHVCMYVCMPHGNRYVM